jgi:pyruvate/oxaloacetate carboxyltransferase
MLIRWLTEENLPYDEVQERLHEDCGIKTSIGALSQFYATQCFSLRFSQAREIADTVAGEMARSPDKFDEATISLIRQKAFERAAARGGNLDELAILAKILHDSAKLRLKEQDLALTERRIKLLEEKAAQADQAKGIVGDKELTEQEKAARLRSLFGMG